VPGGERLHYWGLPLWTFRRNRSQFSLAVILSIYGHHFRKVCAGPQTELLYLFLTRLRGERGWNSVFE